MPTNPNSPRGVLIVGHGTRSSVGTSEFLQTCELVSVRLTKEAAERSQAAIIVRPAFLELQQPTIAQAIDDLASQGVRQLVAMPLLLFSAGHARRDIPQAVEEAIFRHRPLVAKFAAHLGLHPCVVKLSWLRCRELLGQNSARNLDTAETPPKRTALLLIGRGSFDESATAEMLRFAELRRAFDDHPVVDHLPDQCSLLPVQRREVGFYAMARPAWGEVLDRLVAEGFRRIIVQPHLLFQGEILESIEREVSARRSHPATAGIDWRIVERLGVSELLVEAVVERIKAVSF